MKASSGCPLCPLKVPARDAPALEVFNHFCSPRHSRGNSGNVASSPARARRGSIDVPGGFGGVPVDDPLTPSSPWWTHIPPHREDDDLSTRSAPLGGLAGGVLSPRQSLCCGTATPAGGGAGGRSRLAVGGSSYHMQDQVMHDLLEARRLSRSKAGTPADLMLAMLSNMLLGLTPDLRDVELAREMLLKHADPYQPLNLDTQMREANLDADVVGSLMQQLGASGSAGGGVGQGQGQAAAQAAVAGSHGAQGDQSSGSGDEFLLPRLSSMTEVDSLRDALALLLGVGRLAPLALPSPLQSGCVAEGDEGLATASVDDSASDTDGGVALRPCQWVPPPVIDEVERALALADEWKYDTWHLAEVTKGHALSCLAFYLLHREGLVSQFRIEPTKLARLLRTIEQGYADNPYHNSTHAADVLQTFHVLLRGAGLTTHYLDRVGLLAAYFAAVVHDHGHPGLTADFLIATSDPLAVRYNDRSPLENHHGASFFSMLLQPDMNVLTHLAQHEKNAFRKQVIDLVMATDMKQHFTLLAQFNTAHRLSAYNKDVGPWALANTWRGHRPSHGIECETTSGADEVGASNLSFTVHVATDPKPLDDTERTLTLQIVLKAADLGHLGEDVEVHQRWVRALEEEFFRQGAKEQALGLPISPLFDRTKQGVSKSQVGFYDFIALPLVHALASAFPGARPLLACYVTNYDHWRAVEKAVATAAAAAAVASTSADGGEQ
ncbi:hypothetical protein HYH02_003986 [Chlamydomonas schloesseri]|uniref:PDEase domain-containing protein n=1 Tax=Chlamydomonas schloesseri TaxID=2026947 RepID=A0A835WQ69_9CHLO|nr:hypothetical protein HYH02_003986 [Chlamydomonas schloesseri]|eukprot:KAG2451384.1 hypothetical protein HYH02_003986 [Chlamydomonas schloesseri]